jgi:amino acid transporter
LTRHFAGVSTPFLSTLRIHQTCDETAFNGRRRAACRDEALLIALVAMCYPSAPAHAFSFAWFTGADFTPSLFAGGALIALFAFSGWDVTVNLNEETRDGARIAGRGSIVAVVIVSVLLVGFGALALLLLSDAEIESAGINIVFAVAEKLLPDPWDYVAVIAVMLSTVGTLELRSYNLRAQCFPWAETTRFTSAMRDCIKPIARRGSRRC